MLSAVEVEPQKFWQVYVFLFKVYKQKKKEKEKEFREKNIYCHVQVTHWLKYCTF